MARPVKLLAHTDQIIEQYTRGFGLVRIATIYAVSHKTISALLRRNGISLKMDTPLLAGKEEQVKTAYLSGKDIRATAGQFSVSPMTAHRILSDMGVVRSKSEVNRKYAVNETVFDEIDTEEKAYWLGFLYADGCNFLPKHRISLVLQERDKHMVEAFRDFMGYSGPLKVAEPKPVMVRPNRPAMAGRQVGVQISNVRVSDSLLRWGMKSNKTFDIDFPYWIGEPLLAHFIRGFFDGDGTLGAYPAHDRPGSKQYSAGFVGHVGMMTDLRQYLENRLGFKMDQRIGHKEGHPDIQKISMNGRATVIRFGEYIYNGATILLHRKKEKYDAMLADEIKLREYPYGVGRTSRTDAIHINQLLESGLSPVEIMRSTGFSLDIVSDIKNGRTWAFMTNRNRKPAKSALTDEQVVKVRALCDNGGSLNQLSAQFGVSRSTIYNIKTGKYRAV